MANPDTKTMLAAVLDAFGGIDKITLRHVPVPEVGADDVLIRVEAAGVGSWDAVEREGGFDGFFGQSTFPYILGWDGAGTVAAVGAHVTRFKPGDRVYAASMPLPRGGFYAQYAVVNAKHVAMIPGKLTIEQAGAMPWDALTALSGIEALELAEAQSIMIFGASGGIGHFAVQIAKRQGARVLAVASGNDGVALATKLGADAAIDGRKEDIQAAADRFAPGGLDAALVTVGGEATDRALAAVRPGGHIAYPHGVTPEPTARPGIQLLRYNGDRTPPATTKLNHLIDSGPFDIHVAHTFTLDQIADAHSALNTHYVGKIALRMPSIDS